MDDFMVLERLGLPAREKSVYLALLAHGPSNVSQIARATGLHRPTVYQLLPALKEKGLVAYSPKGRRGVYAAESPRKLERLVGDLNDEFAQALPELLHAYAAGDKKPSVKYLEGRKGLSEVFTDLLQFQSRHEVYYRYGSRKKSVDISRYLPPGYRAQRDKKQADHFVITSEAIARDKKPKLGRALKAIPAKEDPFDYNISQLIYGDTVAFIDYTAETALVIKNAAFAEYQKKLFRFLYHRL